MGPADFADHPKGCRAAVTSTPIGIGDVVRAVAAIAPDDPMRWPAIAAALGFAPRDPAAPRGQRSAGAASERADDSAARLPQEVLDTAAAPLEASLPVLEPLGRAAD